MTWFESFFAELSSVTPRLAEKMKGKNMTNGNQANDPPPSKGTNEPWKRPGQASQNPDQKVPKPDLDKWKTAIDPPPKK
jgi:hypothetical protein